MSLTSSIAALHTAFAIPGVAAIVAGRSGLPCVHISTPSAAAHIYLHGAQITSWQPAGHEEVLFLSEHSRWEASRAIRGGIPVCFPWFRGKAGDAQAPAHGFARTTAWQLLAIEQQGASVTVTLALEEDEATRHWWPYAFRLGYRITVGHALTLELTATNTGSEAFEFEEALHTYNRVGDARKARIAGLAGALFLDNMEDNREAEQQGNVLLVRATDNAYIATKAQVELIDPVLGRRIRLLKQGSQTTVIWNPWQEGAEALADLGDEEWTRMACVEAANILGAAIQLAPGQQHTLAATITVEPLG